MSFIVATIITAHLFTYLCESIQLQGSATLSTTGIQLDILIDTIADEVVITLIGPSTAYYGVGFGGFSMNNRYSILASGTNTVSDHVLSKGDNCQCNTGVAGSVISVTSDSTSGLLRTVIVTRPISGPEYSFPTDAGSFAVISAIGTSTAIGYHDSRDSESIMLNEVTTTSGSPTTTFPTTYGPTTDNPTSSAPTTAYPTTNEPTTDTPTTDTPTTDEPTTDEPTTDNPTTDDPTTDNPTSAIPTSNTPTTQNPTTTVPTSDSPTTLEPTTDIPTSDVPTTDVPTVADPTTAIPTTADPTTEDPTTTDPTTAAPTNALPTTNNPTTSDPTTLAPTTATPTTDAPTRNNPTTSKPTTTSTTDIQTTRASPTTPSPITADPTTAVPTSAKPTSPAPTDPTGAGTTITAPTTAAPTSSTTQETTNDNRDCSCTKGIATLTVQYNGYSKANIAVYVKKHDDEAVCEFNDVSPGKKISCSAYSQFDHETYFVVNYDDLRRRLGGHKKRRRKSHKGKAKKIMGDCIGKFKTNCKSQTVGTISDDCDDLLVVSYVDAVGQFCDESVLDQY